MKRDIILYPKKLKENIINHNFIPRRIKPDERLKLYHKYWMDSFKNIVKVVDIINIEETEYYLVTYNNMSAVISYPINYNDTTYEMLHSTNIESEKIINSYSFYTGAEIKYWFIINKDNMTNDEYNGLYPYISGDKELTDNKRYMILKENKEYKILSSKN